MKSHISSRFTIAHGVEERSDYTAPYHTLTDAFVLIPTEVWTGILEKDVSTDPEITQSNSIILDHLKAISGMIPISIECQYDCGSDDYLKIPEMMDDFIREKIAIEIYRTLRKIAN